MCVFIVTWVYHALPNFRHFDDVLNLHLDPKHCFTSTPCLSSSLLPSSSFIIFFYLLTADEDYVLKALVFLIVLYVSSCRRVHFSRAVLV